MEFTQMISTVGFPIAAFMLMFWLVRTTMKENTIAIIELKDAILQLYEIHKNRK